MVAVTVPAAVPICVSRLVIISVSRVAAVA